MEQITGKTLIAWGYEPGRWFSAAIAEAEQARAAGQSEQEIRAIIDAHVPPPPIGLRNHGELAHHMNIRPETDDEIDNVEKVVASMEELMRVPTVKAGAVMPDACPAGALGTIPVGGVVATENAIHPGMHSADICCSVAISIFKGVDPISVLDAGMKLTHFGGGGRPRGQQIKPPMKLLANFENNAFLKPLVSDAIEHFATQGDGNHFFFVGRMASTGDTALVTHHGSRKPGAMLYKSGMKAADALRKKISPETHPQNAWLWADSEDGESYWKALQIIREWTKANHYAIHDMITDHLKAQLSWRFWNEHNFVFRKSDGLFYHAKGATPAYNGWAHDATEYTLVPLNMAEPVLITRGRDAENGLGFAPHGAGRNFSRSQYVRQNADKTEAELVEEQTQGIDCRFFCGIPDVSELPAAYKNADSVRRQTEEYGLAEVADTVEPVGCVMAGDWQRNAPWRQKKKKGS